MVGTERNLFLNRDIKNILKNHLQCMPNRVCLTLLSINNFVMSDKFNIIFGQHYILTYEAIQIIVYYTIFDQKDFAYTQQYNQHIWSIWFFLHVSDKTTSFKCIFFGIYCRLSLVKHDLWHDIALNCVTKLKISIPYYSSEIFNCNILSFLR